MSRTAIVAGVGPGLGTSLARKFAAEGCSVGLFARSRGYVESLADELPTPAVAAEVDITDPEWVARGFERVRDELGPVEILVNHASGAPWHGLQDCSADEFEQAWRVAAYGGFLCSKEALADMRDDGGTILFTGATSAIRGRGGAVGFSSAKFAVRGLAESMARELGPEGIHVAHVVIDGGILPPDTDVDSPEEYLDPEAIAESYWHLVEQDRSAWTLELDLRPHVEEF
ncbi:SDR family NAD(P)-dependent oxidoreductase [Haladaptatus sp. NG-WS-4]